MAQVASIAAFSAGVIPPNPPRSALSPPFQALPARTLGLAFQPFRQFLPDLGTSRTPLRSRLSFDWHYSCTNGGVVAWVRQFGPSMRAQTREELQS
jgi:hypothetical protein